MTSAMLAGHLGVPSAEAPLEGRKLRHILGDLALSDWIARTGQTVKHRRSSLPVFQLTSDGQAHLQSLQTRFQAAQARPARSSGLSTLLQQARPVARPNPAFFQPVSRVVPAPEKSAPVPPYPIVGHAPQADRPLPLADKLACLQHSASQRNSQDLKLITEVLLELHARLQRFERWLGAVHAHTQEVLPKEAS
jgi:hypothetical protein